MLITAGARRTRSRCSPARVSSVESRMKTGDFSEGGSRLTSSNPGRNSHALGTGGEETTATSLPAGRSASASPRADPSVSPSASLWVTAFSRVHGSTISQILGAAAATPGRGGADSGIALAGLLHLPKQLADPHAVGDPFVELENQVWREAEGGEACAELPADEAAGMLQTSDGRLLGRLLAHDADLHRSVAQVGAQLDLGHGCHLPPRVLEIADDDGADLLAELGCDSRHPVATHAWYCPLPPRQADQVGEQAEGGLLNTGLEQSHEEPAGDVGRELHSQRKPFDSVEGVVGCQRHGLPAGAVPVEAGQHSQPLPFLGDRAGDRDHTLAHRAAYDVLYSESEPEQDVAQYHRLYGGVEALQVRRGIPL